MVEEDIICNLDGCEIEGKKNIIACLICRKPTIWCVQNYLRIAFRTKPEWPTSFNMRGTDIECSKEVKLLGIYIDVGLTFNKQNMICKKASQQTCAIMRLSIIISMDIKLAMYWTLILSTFNYCPVM